MLSSLKITLLPLFSLLTFIPIQPGHAVSWAHRLVATNGSLWQALRSKLKFSADHFAIFCCKFSLFHLVSPFFSLFPSHNTNPKTVRIVSEIETKSRFSRFVLNWRTSLLGFHCLCHRELCVPRCVWALPRLPF